MAQMMIECHLVARPKTPMEHDLLQGNESLPLHFTHNGQVLLSLPCPPQGWTHETLEAVSAPGACWDAFLGDQWIGSSEI